MANSLVAQRKFNPSTDVMDEIPRTYYPGRGFLTDQEAYPTDLYGNPDMPVLAGGYMGLFAQGLPFGEQGPAQGPNSPIRFYEDFGQYMPYGPAGGGLPPTPMPDLAQMPRFIRGGSAPRGVIMKAPHIDSPFMDERIKRGFVPMTPPPARGGGPQLPGFV